MEETPLTSSFTTRRDSTLTSELPEELVNVVRESMLEKLERENTFLRKALAILKVSADSIFSGGASLPWYDLTLEATPEYLIQTLMAIRGIIESQIAGSGSLKRSF
jgi:hypothetical protein